MPTTPLVRLGAIATALLALTALVSCTAGEPAAPESAARMAPSVPPYTSEVYANPASWLCRPGSETVCAQDMDAEVLAANGERSLETFTPAADAPVDCFYVYPTVSTDAGDNSDLVPGDSERAAVRSQVARLAGSCRVFAPVYPQVPLGALLGGGLRFDSSDGEPTPFDVAYAGVADAFRHYLANDNNGRGIVFVGHSQGSAHLSRLVTEEIQGTAVADLLVSAVLLGTTVLGGDGPSATFTDIPPCAELGQTGCVLSWSTFRSTAPPPANALPFGRDGDGVAAVCTNPADLSNQRGPVPLTPYFDIAQAKVDTTAPWVALPGLVEGECVTRNGHTYLEITVRPDPARLDDVPGDLTPQWGLHLVDANLAMGQLVEVVAAQAEAWVS
jgi:hypothetical protein